MFGKMKNPATGTLDLTKILNSYLLSLSNTSFGGAATPSVRMVLVGCENPQTKPTFHADTDALIMSEIVEFALSLTPVAKGQESFGGLPHLQAYRLLRAAQLAEVGHVSLANRYAFTLFFNKQAFLISELLLKVLRSYWWDPPT